MPKIRKDPSELKTLQRMSEDQYRHMVKYQTDYNREHYKVTCLKFSYSKDIDILDWMDEQKNISESIKTLIRKDIKYHKRKEYRDRKAAEAQQETDDSSENSDE